ncbi:hypothetical protein FE784_11410 [Paenibacillus hemerocallicola]|uniref:Uncharacterized protein n=1 Tax=Paenibacillus hemerocallicola TaxID=1172614 RepID=A0A5C4TBI0_9BACL|nr:hypothetical protein [Paenibacillus hemerocallicola]TNJ66275.1 hypothetical protein FE784_11410 [Paenibacillus hemerocallicola]
MIRNKRSAMHRRARMLLLTFVVFCLALAPYAALAGKEGIYVSDSVYFTLEKVRLSEASDDSILRFSIGLHNGSAESVDYNYFGVRVTDAAGYSYSAQLTGQQSARVLSGKEQEFAYEARIAKGSQADQLRVALFTWNYGASVSMNDIGSFSVAAAMQSAAETAPLAIVPLSKADTSLSVDDKVEFRIGNEYFVYENNDWNLYIDLIALNAGTSGLTLPSGLKMRLEDSAGQTVAVTAIDGADKSLLPGKPQRISVRAAIPADDSANDWALQFYYLTGTTPTVLDSMAAGKSFKPSAIGDARPITDSQGQETVSVKVESAAISQSADGQWVSAKVRIDNNGSKVTAVPKLTAKVQSRNGGVSVTAEDPSTHAAYLSQNESETFSFNALMPKGVDVSDMQIALFETRTVTGSSNSNTSSNGTANTSGTTGSTTGSGNSNTGGTNSGTSTTTKSIPALIANLDNAQLYVQGSGSDYAIGSKIDLALDKKIDVAVSELKLYENDNNGFKTAIAKLKLTNADTTVLATPDLALELVDASGSVYSGTKQATAATQLATNSSYLISYSFLMSAMDENEPLLLRVYNAKDAGKVPLGTVKTAFQQDNLTDDVWNVFPYKIDLREKLLLHSVLSTTFSYSLRMDLGVQRTEQIISDANLSKLQFELVDGTKQVISTQTVAFLGTTRLLNGTNELTFTNLKLNQFSSLNYINVYEIVDTPNGVVKRKLAEFH